MNKPSKIRQWGYHIGGSIFEKLTPDECETLDRHEAIWSAFQSSWTDVTPGGVERQWNVILDGVRLAEPAALEQYAKWLGDGDNLGHYLRVREDGIHRKFHTENAAKRAEWRPIVQRLLVVFDAHLADYAAAAAPFLARVGATIAKDDPVSRIIATNKRGLEEALAHTGIDPYVPTSYQTFATLPALCGSIRIIAGSNSSPNSPTQP